MAGVTIHTKIYASGEIGVFVRVIHKRKQAKKQLFKVHPKHWNGARVNTSHPHSAKLNKLLRSRMTDIENKIYELEANGVSYSAHDLLDPRSRGSLLVDCILDYAETKPHTANRKYTNVAQHLQRFRPKATLANCNLEFLQNFGLYLSGLDTIGSSVTVNRYLKCLKTVLIDQARKGNYADQRVLNYNIPKGRKTYKHRLTKEEVERFASCEICTEPRDAFLMCLYTGGTRIRDVLLLRPQNIVSDRLIFTEQKTGKQKSVKIRPEVQQIIDRYPGGSYLLPFIKQNYRNPKIDKRFNKHIEGKVTKINVELKLIAKWCKIDKNISTNVARHTFASWAVASGVKSRTLQSILNHSDLKTTEEYLGQLKVDKENDDAADRVFG